MYNEVYIKSAQCEVSQCRQLYFYVSAPTVKNKIQEDSRQHLEQHENIPNKRETLNKIYIMQKGTIKPYREKNKDKLNK